MVRSEAKGFVVFVFFVCAEMTDGGHGGIVRREATTLCCVDDKPSSPFPTPPSLLAKAMCICGFNQLPLPSVISC